MGDPVCFGPKLGKGVASATSWKGMDELFGSMAVKLFPSLVVLEVQSPERW